MKALINSKIKCFQSPLPGTSILRFRGATQTFTLSLSFPAKGTGWIRTNIGHAKKAQDEIIANIFKNEPVLGIDWYDLPMKKIDDLNFKTTIPLIQVGHFEAKCFFLEEGSDSPIWPKGKNTEINIEPADTCCANIIYNAFVRQFGPNIKKNDNNKLKNDLIKSLDKMGYTVIPPSGTFRDMIKKLDFIINILGCRIIQLLPIHSTPTTYAKMGLFGSPFAALSFTDVNPELAEFDPYATPLEQFKELVDEIHSKNAKIILDFVTNHTGWAADLHETHPEWLVRKKDGRIVNPSAWGTIWEDLTKLDYSDKALWKYMAGVFVTWCKRGVDGFRCDAGYMIPAPAWKFITAYVRRQYPDTIFFLEGLGGKISVTKTLLSSSNFNWAYSELFQNYNQQQINNYLPLAATISNNEGIMVNFAETHDNNRLAARSKTFAEMRTALCAFSSFYGAFGFTNGVEWFATEKINVHQSPSLNWGARSNQVNHIRRINIILKTHPAFFDQTEIKFVKSESKNHIIFLRNNIPTGEKLLIIVNLDYEKHSTCSWNYRNINFYAPFYYDLLTKNKIDIKKQSEKFFQISLAPGQVLCLTTNPVYIEIIKKAEKIFFIPEKIKKQSLFAKVLDIFSFFHGIKDVSDFDIDLAANKLFENPAAFCKSINPQSHEPCTIIWQWPTDVKREVMIPPGHLLIIISDRPFCAQITDADNVIFKENCLESKNNSYFAVFPSFLNPDKIFSCLLKLTVFISDKCDHVEAPLLFLPNGENCKIQTIFKKAETDQHNLLFLGTNRRGSMTRANISWGMLKSKYDALLAANINTKYPEDLWIMFARCRGWVVFQGFSHEISFKNFDSFHYDNNSLGTWNFNIPTGHGKYIILSITIKIFSGENKVNLLFYRHNTTKKNTLCNKKTVNLILRPDIENRNFHETTKAYKLPEELWHKSVSAKLKSFTFSPDSHHKLDVDVSKGFFIYEHQWQYMVKRDIEADRGLDPHSDLYSPGYFKINLDGGNKIEMSARINDKEEQKKELFNIKKPFFKENAWEDPSIFLKKAMDHFIVKRKNFSSVIAGYPWFLDWGRDSLIFLRGLIATKRTLEARNVLSQFAIFEKDGTLPNMIRGDNAQNRDTSDAPLWFFVACSDLINVEKNDSFLHSNLKGRTIRQILISMGNSFIHGTPNGIKTDPASGLIFSPSHFTWMDTNFPAGTPRAGYPIEIQALWYFALSFLSVMDSSCSKWKKLAIMVQNSIADLFIVENKRYLSDCLHACENKSAKQAVKDDALRPNQLFAITLGAVKCKVLAQSILAACQELIVPGAIRSLADRPVCYPLAITSQGKTLNDPEYPYQGKYSGDEDTKRKIAYHNGTAWTWLFPSYCEAWAIIYGNKGKKTALSWLASSLRLVNTGCMGHVPEILDGDFPHKQKGCDAQAWGLSELLRVWLKLSAI